MPSLSVISRFVLGRLTFILILFIAPMSFANGPSAVTQTCQLLQGVKGPFLKFTVEYLVAGDELASGQVTFLGEWSEESGNRSNEIETKWDAVDIEVRSDARRVSLYLNAYDWAGLEVEINQDDLNEATAIIDFKTAETSLRGIYRCSAFPFEKAPR